MRTLWRIGGTICAPILQRSRSDLNLRKCRFDGFIAIAFRATERFSADAGFEGPLAELVDAADLKSVFLWKCRFESGRGYQPNRA